MYLEIVTKESGEIHFLKLCDSCDGRSSEVDPRIHSLGPVFCHSIALAILLG